jgi:hypothetical protein
MFSSIQKIQVSERPWLANWKSLYLELAVIFRWFLFGLKGPHLKFNSFLSLTFLSSIPRIIEKFEETTLLRLLLDSVSITLVFSHTEKFSIVYLSKSNWSWSSSLGAISKELFGGLRISFDSWVTLLIFSVFLLSRQNSALKSIGLYVLI